MRRAEGEWMVTAMLESLGPHGWKVISVYRGSSNLVTVKNLHPVHCRNPRQPQPSFSASSQTPHPQVHTLCIASFPSGPSSVQPGSSHLPTLSLTHLFCFLSRSRHTCTLPTLIQSFASSLPDLRKTPPTPLVYVTSLSPGSSFWPIFLSSLCLSASFPASGPPVHPLNLCDFPKALSLAIS